MKNLKKYVAMLERARERLASIEVINTCYRNDMDSPALLEHFVEMTEAKKDVADLTAIVAECKAVDHRLGVGRRDHFALTAPDTYPGVRVNG